MFCFRWVLVPREPIVHRFSIKRCASSKKTSPSLEYCVNLARKLDYENYLCSLLLPSSIRATAVVVRAFNIEISKIQEQVSEPHLGMLRLKFWDDCIDGIYQEKVPEHPVAKQIYAATKRHKLTKTYFKRIISARVAQLNSSCFQDMKTMENYADYTTSSVHFLLLEALGIKDINCDHAASHLGKSQGVSNLLRALPHNMKYKSLYLPQDLLAKNNISEESLYRFKFTNSFEEVIFQVASVAKSNLNMVYNLQSKIPKECHTIFLPAVPTMMYLKTLERNHFNVLDADTHRSFFLPYILFWKKFNHTLL